MMRSFRHGDATALLLCVAVAGCSMTSRHSASASAARGSPGDVSLTPAAQARADGGQPAYTAADVRFMQGMIGHHAQAVVMAGWAPSHGARADVRILAERIDVAQRDEIAMMQRWLRERNQTVPDPGAHHEHGGMAEHAMLMPGMLTAEELTQLDRATGPEFDRLFLTFMIRHHQGAITMVGELLASPGAAQDTDIYRFSSDVNVDQITEIERMRSMLSAPAPDKSKP